MVVTNRRRGAPIIWKNQEVVQKIRMKGCEEGPNTKLVWALGQYVNNVKQLSRVQKNSESRLTRVPECLLFVDSPAELLGP